jgi:tetratricopeptide (TPR) repeat protein
MSSTARSIIVTNDNCAAGLQTARDSWSAREAELELLTRANPKAARPVAEQWFQHARSGTEEHARAVRAYALALRDSGSPQEAVLRYQDAEELFAQLGLELEVARTAVGQVAALRQVGRYADALQLGVRARRKLRTEGERVAVGRLTINLGAVYRRLGRLETARRCYLEANRLARYTHDDIGEAVSIQNLANVLVDLGRYDEAERAQRHAIRLYGRLKQPSKVAMARSTLGRLLKRRGDYGRALAALNESRKTYETLGLLEGRTEVDLFLTQAYLALNLQREASEASHRAVEGYTQLGLPYERAQALLWSAAVAERQNRRVEAREYLADAAESFERIGNQHWQAAATLLKANLEEPNETILNEVAAAELRLKRLGARDGVAEARLIQGDLLQQLGQANKAKARYRAAARTAQTLGDQPLSYRVQAALGSVLESSNPRRALTHYETAISHLEAIRRRARADDLKISFIVDKVDVYERTVGLLLDQTKERRRTEHALRVVEQGKSLGLLDDLLTQAEHGSRASAAMARRLRDLRSHLSEAYARRDSEWGRPSEHDLASVSQLEQEVAQATRDLQLSVRGDAETAPFELERLRAALPAGSVLLEFYSLGDELVCFAVDKHQLALHRALGTVADARHLSNRLRFQFGKGIYGASYIESRLPQLRSSLNQVLATLWQQLLAPLAATLAEADHVVIVPHGPLHGLPFHAAFDGNAYLTDRTLVSYAPSARVFMACVERHAKAPKRPLFVAPYDAQLPWLAREVAQLKQLFPEGEALAGRRATIPGLRRRAGQFDLLHLAAHGTFRSDNPHFSSIQLADGWLSVADLAELSHGTALVALSACETGLNTLETGEELIGLTRAVLGAGAACLLASLWTVHDRATSVLMTEFYRGLERGLGKAESLQIGMQAVRRELDHPFFWAPFALAGAA